MKNGGLPALVNFIYEAGMLSKTPRSGFWFLGTGEQSVAEHIARTVFIGYVLSYLMPGVKREKVILMCLVHDLGEARTSDLNYVHQKYGRLAEARAIADLAESVPFGAEIKSFYDEMAAKNTPEAKLVKDADILEWLATLREEEERGNLKAHAWAGIAFKRLKTLAGKKLGKLLLATHPDRWWFKRNDQWFVNRGPQYQKWH